MIEEQQRPPPIIVGVSGIEARSDMVEAPEPQSAVDWFRLFRLPSFEMFLDECVIRSAGMDDLNIKQEYTNQFMRALKDMSLEPQRMELFEQYQAWHTVKGYWSNEDCFGNLIGE